jgi:prolipoprotein diacylglyceryltransferase
MIRRIEFARHDGAIRIFLREMQQGLSIKLILAKAIYLFSEYVKKTGDKVKTSYINEAV